jgi:hypothetical protein
MKLSDVKHQIDTYFNSVNPLDIVKQFEVLGYEFEDADYLPFDDYIVTFKAIKSTQKVFSLENYSNNNDDDDLTTIESIDTNNSKVPVLYSNNKELACAA